MSQPFLWPIIAVRFTVAAVLLFVTLAAQAVLPTTAAAAMILGANLGGALIAFVLTLSAPIAARRMVIANLILRGGGAVAVTFLIVALPEFLNNLGETPARQAINLHLVFNLALAVVALPFVSQFMTALTALIPDRPADVNAVESATALDPTA